MRLSNETLHETDKEKVAIFANWLLDIGNGNIGVPDEVDPKNTSWVDIPDMYRILDDEHGMVNLIRVSDGNVDLAHAPELLRNRCIYPQCTVKIEGIELLCTASLNVEIPLIARIRPI
nr:DNA helicase [Tanacetum cinerariifolium]